MFPRILLAFVFVKWRYLGQLELVLKHQNLSWFQPLLRQPRHLAERENDVEFPPSGPPPVPPDPPVSPRLWPGVWGLQWGGGGGGGEGAGEGRAAGLSQVSYFSPSASRIHQRIVTRSLTRAVLLMIATASTMWTAISSLPTPGNHGSRKNVIKPRGEEEIDNWNNIKYSALFEWTLYFYCCV